MTNFTTACFIRANTKEIRDRLEYIGYGASYTEGDILHVNGKDYCAFLIEYAEYGDEYLESFTRNYPNAIDCGTNIDLFLAIAALRDDSDYMQWFTNGRDWCFCHLNNFDHFAFVQRVEASMDLILNWHKATIEELVQHFNK